MSTIKQPRMMRFLQINSCKAIVDKVESIQHAMIFSSKISKLFPNIKSINSYSILIYFFFYLFFNLNFVSFKQIFLSRIHANKTMFRFTQELKIINQVGGCVRAIYLFTTQSKYIRGL